MLKSTTYLMLFFSLTEQDLIETQKDNSKSWYIYVPFFNTGHVEEKSQIGFYRLALFVNVNINIIVAMDISGYKKGNFK